MSLSEARNGLLVALNAAGIDTYYGWGVFSAPCARIFPGEPWVALSGMAGGRRLQRWEIWAVAGNADSGATYDDLEGLVQEINDAVNQMPGFGTVEWHRPASVDMGGTRYLASRGVIEALKEA